MKLCNALDVWYLKNSVKRLIATVDSIYLSEHVRSPSIAHMSYLVHARQLRNTSLPHASIKFFHPLFDSIFHFISSSNYEMIDFTTILHQLSAELWNSIQSTIYQIDLVVVLVHRLWKLVQSQVLGVHLPFASLLQSISDLHSSLEVDKLRMCSLLWKKGTITTLVNKDLHDISLDLYDLESRMDFWKMDPQGNFLF